MSRRKAFGQHFLKDRGVLRKIVEVIAPALEDTIIEIGAGKGILTFALAEKAGRVIAIEKDKAFIAELGSRNFPNLEVLEADVLEIDFSELASGRDVKVAGNLPYSISSPVLFKVLDSKDMFSQAFFLLQKEVADRLCASPGTKKYAPLSILYENHFIRKSHFTVPPQVFSPSPKVESGFVSLTKREKPLFMIREEQAFRKFLRACFRHRRKTLFNNLRLLDVGENTLKEMLDQSGIDGRVRAEAVSLDRLAELFERTANLHPRLNR
jgi:16S rRNA (adenine1518-N6/adenine1519-N6)-dimethyltransferase